MISGYNFLNKTNNLANKNNENCLLSLKKLEIPYLSIDNPEEKKDSPCTVEQLNNIISNFNKKTMGIITPVTEIRTVKPFITRSYTRQSEPFIETEDFTMNPDDYNIIYLSVKFHDFDYAYASGGVDIEIFDENDNGYIKTSFSFSLWNSSGETYSQQAFFLYPFKNIKKLKTIKITSSNDYYFKFDFTYGVQRFVVQPIPEIKDLGVINNNENNN